MAYFQQQQLLQQQKCPMLLIAGVTQPKSKTATKRKGAGSYLGGVKEDMRNMEDYINNSDEFSLYNSVRDMRHLKLQKVIAEIRGLSRSAHKSQTIGIYYSGHGNQDGSWCFADGELEWQDIEGLIECGNIRIFCDSCFSGNWAKQLQSLEGTTKDVLIFAASYPAKVAIDSDKGGKATVEWLKLLPFIFDHKICSKSQVMQKFQGLYGCIGYIDNKGKYTFHLFRDPDIKPQINQNQIAIYHHGQYPQYGYFKNPDECKDDDHKSNVKTCNKGHSLKLLTVNQLSYSSKTFGCDGCLQNSRTMGFYYVYHCKYCQYDLCKGCYNNNKQKPSNKQSVTCSKGHGLRKFGVKQLPYKYGFGCDLCGEGSLKNGFKYSYHCSICQYDLCDLCYQMTKLQNMKI